MIQNDNQLGAAQQRPRHAGVGVRIGAGIVDFVVLAIPVTLVLCLIFGVSECVDAVLSQIDPEHEPVGESTLNTLNIIAGVILAIITVVLWVNWDGGTPGGKVFKIKIVSYPDYMQFAYGQATIRLAGLLLAAITLGVGYLVIIAMVAARDDKRGYQDLWAQTVVVHD